MIREPSLLCEKGGAHRREKEKRGEGEEGCGKHSILYVLGERGERSCSRNDSSTVF